jgi:hypothetical protein
VAATAIALKKMIHFRIQIPSVNLRSYARRFENTRQKGHYRSQKLEDTGCIALGALGPPKSKGQMLQFRDNATVV